MDYLIVEDGIITNVVVAEPDVAEVMGLLPWYEGADIGLPYEPPVDPTPTPEPEPEEESSVWDELDAAYQEGVDSV